MSRSPVRKGLLLLGALGVLMTLSVSGAAIVCLVEVSEINRELAQINRAQRFHQNADMMHDALRADVARAELAGSAGQGVSAGVVRRETTRHAAQFRSDLRSAGSLDLPQGINTQLSQLRPVQEIYIVAAESRVESSLANGGSAPGAQASYEAAFQHLVPAQARMTDRLVETSARIERAATETTNEAIGMIGLATVVAVVSWLVLVSGHTRSVGNLRGALVREAEQRSAADLLQRSLLPMDLPSVPGAQLAARLVPGCSGQRVGGDWYDVVSLPSGEICLVVGDVMGHDLPAATVMGQLRNALRAYALEDAAPATVLERVNRAAYLLDVSDLTTCICAVLDPATMQVSWSSAGHLPPLVSSAAGVGCLLGGEPGPPLGVTSAAEYPQYQVQLAPGETLLLYSDGLVERRDTSIDSRLTTLEAAVIPRVGPEEVCDQLLTTMLSDGGNRDDDVTLLLLQVEPRSLTQLTAHSQAHAGV